MDCRVLNADLRRRAVNGARELLEREVRVGVGDLVQLIEQHFQIAGGIRRDPIQIRAHVKCIASRSFIGVVHALHEREVGAARGVAEHGVE